jgi:hypothetical protein
VSEQQTVPDRTAPREDWEDDGDAVRWEPDRASAQWTSDPALETEAMSEVYDALEPLDDDARSRVLRWAAERYGTTEGRSWA